MKLLTQISETAEGRWEVTARIYEDGKATSEKKITFDSIIVASAMVRFIERVGESLGMEMEIGADQMEILTSED